jgi:hypothetical protein
MDEPQEVTDRRWRCNLMGAVEGIADSGELHDLNDTELIPRFFDCVTDDCVPHGDGAMTKGERAAALNLCESLNQICEKARLMKRDRIGGKVVHGLDPDDLVTLGWFERLQPLARETFDTFMLRGWMSEDL